MKIFKNVDAPSYAYRHKYIVMTVDNNNLYFFGASDNLEKAQDIANAYGSKMVFENDDYVGD